MFIKKRNALFGRYPCCDMVNNAMRHILNGRSDGAIEELLQAIGKANGYLHKDIEEDVQKIHKRFWKNENTLFGGGIGRRSLRVRQ